LSLGFPNYLLQPSKLGPSALAGFCLFFIMTPVQQQAMAYQFTIRQKSMRWTDQRANLVQELLGGMRVVKWFTYEQPLLKRQFSGVISPQKLKSSQVSWNCEIKSSRGFGRFL